ncbi:hypothetical protein ES705_27586 [subsurface metagenome]
MEIGDIFVINKKDIDGAEKLKAEIDYVLGIKYLDSLEDRNPIVMISAKNNEGIDELVNITYAYFDKIDKNGLLIEKRKNRIEKKLRKIFSKKIHDVLDVQIEFSRQIEKWVELIYSREVKPYALINDKINNFLKELTQDKE